MGPKCRPSLELEYQLRSSGCRLIAGVDEVGRGSWAGPIVAAAVILPLDRRRLRPLAGLRDSKQLPPSERERLSRSIARVAVDIGIGWASHHVIDRLGIVSANRMAMERALRHLRLTPDGLLLDYVWLPECGIPQIAAVRGDSRSISIAAASVIAKVVRDRWMTSCEGRYPGYGFARHKGYGTAVHRGQLLTRGPCLLHRRSFLTRVDAR